MNDQRWLSYSFLVFFFTWGVFLPYWTGWLTLEKGLSIKAASIIMGAGMITRSFSTFLLFPYLTKKIALSRVIQWLTILSFVIALLYIPFNSFLSLFVITFVFSALYPMILPAVESSATTLMQHGKIHYGKSRSYGSIGYTIALFIIGAATEIWTETAILYIMLLGLMAMMFFYLMPSPPVLSLQPKPQKEVTNKKRLPLFQIEGFAIVLILAILLQGAHTSYYNYSFIYLDELGVNGFSIGVILNIAVLFEILFFTKADQLLATTRTSTMFLIAAIGSTVRWSLLFLFPTTLIFVFSQVLHALSFGIAHFAFIQFITKKIPDVYIPTAQGLYAAFAMSLSTALLTFPAGFLYEISPRAAFLGMTVCSVPAIILILFTRQKMDSMKRLNNV